VRAHAAVFGIQQRGVEVSVGAVAVDEGRGGYTRLRQTVKGIPVFGGEAIVHMKADGAVVDVSDGFVRGMSAAPVATLAVDAAIARAKEVLGCSSCLTAAPRAALVFLRHAGRDHLAYKVDLRILDGTARTSLPVLFIDARDGALVWRYDNLQTVQGSGSSLYSGTVAVEAFLKSANATYYLEDLGRKLGTFDYRNGTLAVLPFDDANNVWDAAAQRAAVDAHYGAMKVYEYYRTAHGRLGIDGNGGPLTQTSQDGVTKLVASQVHYGNAFNNAFWDGTSMSYGDGDGVAFSPLPTLDITGHEMTHGVTEHSANLIFAGESGALNESTSDIFGSLIERYARGGVEDGNTWRVGEDAYTPGTSGDALRFLDNPHQAANRGLTADDDPDHWSERYTGTSDNGGVHTNSGIPNKAFHLVAKGGSHHLGTDVIDPEGTPPGANERALGADAAARIWYRALTQRWTSAVTFKQAAAELYNAAVDLYGAGSAESRTVAKAWTMVGVAVDVTPPTTSITSPTSGATVAGTVTVTATASDDDVVAAVELYVDGTLRGTDTSAPFAIAWQTGLDGNGAHTLTTRAYDAAGRVGTSAPVPVTVSNETVVPSVSITAPASGAVVSGTVAIAATASDNVAVARVEFYAGATLVGSDDTAPYQADWDSSDTANGSVQTLTAKAFDTVFNSATSAPVTVTVQNPFVAVYDPTLRAPRCTAIEAGCDTYRLVDGRAAMGPEQNAPNTINSSCADNTGGLYHFDESLDRLRVTTVDGTPLGSGKTVTIEATVWVYSETADHLDLYHAPDATSPSWTLIGTLQPTASGRQVLSTTFTLPLGTLQAIRGNWRFSGSAGVCTSSGYDDRDDLVFGVSNPPDLQPPTAAITAPASGATVGGTVAVNVTASDDVGVTRVELLVDGALVGTDFSPPYQLSWNSKTSANGPHTLTARAFDFAGKTGTSAGVPVTVDNDLTAPTVAITAPADGAVVSGIVAVTASASDNVGVSKVDFYVDGTLRGTDTSAPYQLLWDAGPVSAGSHTLQARASDAENNEGTSPLVTVTVEQPFGAVYDPVLRVPRCTMVLQACDTFALVNSRGTLVPAEPNTPNTINNSCLDGSSGTYHNDESIDRLRITTTDGTPLAPGKTVRIEATVWVYSTGGSDALDLYYAADATNPVWTFISTQATTGPGTKVLSATYTLPAGPLQAVRANWRYQGSASPCSPGAYDDRDDLVFAVASGPDTTPPAVSLTAPAEGSLVRGVVSVTASASDNVGVSRVELLVDGLVAGTDSAAPFAFAWDTAAVSEGPHQLAARAFDAADNSTTSAAVSVTVDRTPPAVTLTAPAAGALLRGTVSLTATASDAAGVASVAFLLDGTTLLGTVSAAPYVISWGSAAASDGSHSITARALDAAGNSADSAAASVTIDNTAPAVAITSPTAGASVSGTVTVTATASDGTTGIAAVDFLVDGVLTGTDPSSPYAFVWDTASAGAGSHTLLARARDAAGNEGPSGAVPVNVLGGPQYVWLEAEGGTITAPMQVANDAAASGGKYIQVAAGNNSNTSPPAGGHALLPFAVTVAGSYKVWGRVIAPTTADDSFYVRIDTGAWMSWNGIPAGTTWHWDDVHNGGTASTPAATFTLAAGNHTLEIAYREDGARLDRLLVTSDAAFVPTGLGPPTVPPPPTGLTASPGDARVTLAWTASAGATSYRVKRGPMGGPYPTELPDVTATSTADTTVTNGTPYCYVVTARNSVGESGNSNEACATPSAAAYIFAEAENGTLTAPMQIANDTTASGGRYIQVAPGNNSNTAPAATGRARYPFTAPLAGNYKVWGRVIAPTTADDSFYVRIDTGAWMTWNGIPLGASWHWDDVHNGGTASTPATLFNLTAGNHTLELAYREDGTKLDRVLVTSDLAFTPTGAGAPPQALRADLAPPPAAPPSIHQVIEAMRRPQTPAPAIVAKELVTTAQLRADWERLSASSQSVASLLAAGRYQVLRLAILDDEDARKSPGKYDNYRVLVFDYATNQAYNVYARLGLAEPVAIQPVQGQPDSTMDEYNHAAFALVRQNPELAALEAQGRLALYPAMPGVLPQFQERTLAVGIRPTGSGGVIHGLLAVNMVQRKVGTWTRGASSRARSIAELTGRAARVELASPAQVPLDQMVVMADVTACEPPPGFSDNGSADTDGTQVLGLTWGDWNLHVVRPWSSAPQAPGHSASNPEGKGGALEIRNVYWKGKSVFFRAHVPILTAKYNGGGCGPYRDWVFEESKFAATIPGNGVVINNPAETILENDTDQGNFKGVAIWAEWDERYQQNRLVMVTELRAAWYRYIQKWSFYEFGVMRPEFGFEGTQDSCTCLSHNHHPYWRFDFDIGDPGNDAIYEYASSSYRSAEFGSPRALAGTTFALAAVQDRETGDQVTMYAGFNDGTVLNPAQDQAGFGVNDWWGLAHHGNELYDGVGAVQGADSVIRPQINNWITGESLAGTDIVLWYGAHFLHDELGPEPKSHYTGPILVPSW
jgi:Zn-dependent metalloprotease